MPDFEKRWRTGAGTRSRSRSRFQEKTLKCKHWTDRRGLDLTGLRDLLGGRKYSIDLVRANLRWKHLVASVRVSNECWSVEHARFVAPTSVQNSYFQCGNYTGVSRTLCCANLWYIIVTVSTKTRCSLKHNLGNISWSYLSFWNYYWSAKRQLN